MQSTLRGTVGILGFGVDGQGVWEFASHHEGIEEILVFDDSPSGRWNFHPSQKSEEVQVSHSLDGVDLLFRSPGFPLTHPLIVEAKEKGIEITSSTTHVLQYFPGTTVGITGSNGKTTCVALIEEFLKAEYGAERVERGGNDGVPRLDLLEADKTQEDFLVLEISSFQLIDSPEAPNVAVILNLTPNHLDWHADMDEYAAAKKRIVHNQNAGDIAVLNQHDSIVKAYAEDAPSEVRWLEDLPDCSVLCKSHMHTLQAAVTAARALKVSEENIVKVLESFPGVPHRLEFVRELDGVKFFNDSSCTTPESAITACEAFEEGALILLIGGRDKEMEFSSLYKTIKERNVRVVPYGEMAETFVQALPSESVIENPQPTDFQKTIELAQEVAKEGDNVVLSPTCASFDMFKNAKERGREFARIVQSL